MIRKLTKRWCAGVLLSSPVLSAACAPAGAAPITVHVQVLDHTGHPIAGVPVASRTSAAIGVCTPTDAQGRCELVVDPPEGDRVVAARIVSTRDQCGTAGQDMAWREQIRALVESSCIDQETVCLLQRGVNTYDVVLRVKARAVAAGTASEGGQPRPLLAFSRCFAGISGADDGAWRVPVPRGEHSKVFLVTSTGIVWPVTVNAPQGAATVAVGDIAVSSRARNATVRMDATHVDEWLEAEALDVTEGVTLVADDGSGIYTTAAPLREPGATGPNWWALAVPAGEYFVIDGEWEGSAVQVAILDAISAGADLTNCGVPRVTAVEGQTVDVQVDLMATYRALHNLRVYSVQP